MQIPLAVQGVAPSSDESPGQSQDPVQWSDRRVIRLPQEMDLEYSRFGLTPEQIGVQFWSNPVPGDLRMVRPSSVKIVLLEFDVSTARSGDIGRAWNAVGRFQR